MEAALARRVWQRADARCEYCRIGRQIDDNPLEIDHIISKKHHGSTTVGNLALSCFYCNSFKGTDIAGRDRRTRKLTPLFNPRRHRWARHFQWDGPRLVGKTAVGRVTVALLHINDNVRVAIREALIEEGGFPPEE